MRRASGKPIFTRTLIDRLRMVRGNATDLVLLSAQLRGIYLPQSAASATPRMIGKPEREAFAVGYRGAHEAGEEVF